MCKQRDRYFLHNSLYYSCASFSSYFQEVRSRFRYLSHVPLTCELALCELDLRPPTLSCITLSQFSDEIQRRRQKRIKKKRDERKRERRAKSSHSYSRKTLMLIVVGCLEVIPLPIKIIIIIKKNIFYRKHLSSIFSIRANP